MMQFASCFGVDGVSISDIQYSLDRFGESYCRRIYSQAELSSVRLQGGDMAASLAVIFSAKEAVCKALGVADRAFSWRDVEVLPEPGASMKVRLHGSLKRQAPEGATPDIRVSFTRAGNLVVALAVVQR